RENNVPSIYCVSLQSDIRYFALGPFFFIIDNLNIETARSSDPVLRIYCLNLESLNLTNQHLQQNLYQKPTSKPKSSSKFDYPEVIAIILGSNPSNNKLIASDDFNGILLAEIISSRKSIGNRNTNLNKKG
ncbi:hypothetical protein C5167_018039, partial [Papaver somniferum]